MSQNSHTSDSRQKVCFFCESSHLRQLYAGLFHPQKRDHGPFDFYECVTCGSGLTLPPPSAESLVSLYGLFESGLPGEMRQWRREEPQTAWYQQCLDHAMARAHKSKNDTFLWTEVGAGEGELALLAAHQYPNAKGIAVDLHNRPKLLDNAKNVEWTLCDINRQAFETKLKVQADVVISISVWEHVRRPDWFAASLAKMVKKDGTLYLVCPDYGSAASRMLGKHWPYFTPGEHLCMPTITGAKEVIGRAAKADSLRQSIISVFVQRISLPYTIRYFMRFFRLTWFADLFPQGWTLPLPAGALEAGFTSEAAGL